MATYLFYRKRLLERPPGYRTPSPPPLSAIEPLSPVISTEIPDYPSFETRQHPLPTAGRTNFRRDGQRNISMQLEQMEDSIDADVFVGVPNGYVQVEKPPESTAASPMDAFATIALSMSPDTARQADQQL